MPSYAFSIKKSLDILFNFYNNYIIAKVVVLLIILAIVYALKNVFSNLIIYLIEKLAIKDKKDSKVIKSMELIKAPAKLFITTLLFYIAIINILPLTPFLFGIITKINQSLIAVSIFWALYKFDIIVVLFLRKGYIKISENNLLVPFFRNVYKVIMFTLGIIIAVEQWYDVGVIIAGLGISGLAFALAAKDTAANLFGSIVILLEKTFSIGDHIKVKGTEGIIEDIGFRSTKIRNSDNAIITIPNSIMGTEEIINWSRRSVVKIQFSVDLVATTPYDKIVSTINDIKELIESEDKIDKTNYEVLFNEMTLSVIKLNITYFILSTDKKENSDIQHRISLGIKKVIDK